MSTSSLFEFFSILHLYYLNMDLSNGDYYMIDIFTYFPLSLLLVMTVTSEILTSDRPPSNIFNVPMVVRVLGQLLINFSFNSLAVSYYKHSPNFLALNKIGYMDSGLVSHLYYIQTFGICGLCSWATLTAGLLFSKGYPFKKEWYQIRFFVYFVIFSVLM